MTREEMLETMDDDGIRNEEVLAACAALGDTALSDEAVEYIFNKRVKHGDLDTEPVPVSQPEMDRRFVVACEQIDPFNRAR